MRRNLTLVIPTAALAAVALTAAGCGSSSSSAASTTPATTAAATTTETPALSPTSTVGDVETEAPATTAPATGTPAGTTKIAVTMGKPNEFSMVAAPKQVKAGKTTLVVTNKGTILHEMVLVKAASAAAVTQADGTANEDTSVGEVPDVKAGKGGKLTVTLPAGKYVLLCNLPGHFAGGMYTTLVVK